jgi:AcrR family transcriptional regulator
MTSVSNAKQRLRGHKRPRVRRGNAEDAQRLRQELLQAAMRLFATRGIEGLSMRAIAERVGVSAMTPYRYFEDKAALLRGLWQFSLTALHEKLLSAVAAEKGGRARQRAFFVAYLDFWESNPNHFWLVHLTQGIRNGDTRDGDPTVPPVFADLLALLRHTTHAMADEIGAKRTWAKLSEDVTFAMLLGYLQSVLMNYRYPWGDRAELRATYIEQVMLCKEQCLLRGPSLSVLPRAAGKRAQQVQAAARSGARALRS